MKVNRHVTKELKPMKFDDSEALGKAISEAPRPTDRGSKTEWTDELRPLSTQSQPHFSMPFFQFVFVIESETPRIPQH